MLWENPAMILGSSKQLPPVSCQLTSLHLLSEAITAYFYFFLCYQLKFRIYDNWVSKEGLWETSHIKALVKQKSVLFQELTEYSGFVGLNMTDKVQNYWI